LTLKNGLNSHITLNQYSFHHLKHKESTNPLWTDHPLSLQKVDHLPAHDIEEALNWLYESCTNISKKVYPTSSELAKLVPKGKKLKVSIAYNSPAGVLLVK